MNEHTYNGVTHIKRYTETFTFDEMGSIKNNAMR